MYLCYIDESGCTGALPSTTSPVQPVFVLAALVLDARQLTSFTREFLFHKCRNFPASTSTGKHYLDSVLTEIKGAELRKDAASSSRRKRRHAIGFLDGFVDMLVSHQATIFGRVWVKGIGSRFEGAAVYTSSIQHIYKTFEEFLKQRNDQGFVIADSRNKTKNTRVAHSIFTQKFQTSGDPYGLILEMPTFGHSDNHVGIQAIDLVCSALLFPMAVVSYCIGHVDSLHVRPEYLQLKERFGATLQNMQFRYQDAVTSKWCGGITVSDWLTQRPGGVLFKNQ